MQLNVHHNYYFSPPRVYVYKEFGVIMDSHRLSDSLWSLTVYHG